jgi:hypothetical protein
MPQGPATPDYRKKKDTLVKDFLFDNGWLYYDLKNNGEFRGLPLEVYEFERDKFAALANKYLMDFREKGSLPQPAMEDAAKTAMRLLVLSSIARQSPKLPSRTSDPAVMDALGLVLYNNIDKSKFVNKSKTLPDILKSIHELNSSSPTPISVKAEAQTTLYLANDCAAEAEALKSEVKDVPERIKQIKKSVDPVTGEPCVFGFAYDDGSGLSTSEFKAAKKSAGSSGPDSGKLTFEISKDLSAMKDVKYPVYINCPVKYEVIVTGEPGSIWVGDDELKITREKYGSRLFVKGVKIEGEQMRKDVSIVELTALNKKYLRYLDQVAPLYRKVAENSARIDTLEKSASEYKKTIDSDSRLRKSIGLPDIQRQDGQQPKKDEWMSNMFK